MYDLVSGDGPENLWSESVPMSRRVSHVSRDRVMHHMALTTPAIMYLSRVMYQGVIITPRHVTSHTKTS